MATRKPKAQIEKLLNRLSNGKNLTASEANRLGITSLRQRVADLRNDGFVIYTNRITKNGRKVYAYRLHR